MDTEELKVRLATTEVLLHGLLEAAAATPSMAAATANSLRAACEDLLAKRAGPWDGLTSEQLEDVAHAVEIASAHVTLAAKRAQR